MLYPIGPYGSYSTYRLHLLCTATVNVHCVKSRESGELEVFSSSPSLSCMIVLPTALTSHCLTVVWTDRLRCVNENHKKRKRLRWISRNKRKCQPIRMLGRSSGNHDWLLANASACVSCGFRLRKHCVWMETGLELQRRCIVIIATTFTRAVVNNAYY